MKEKLRKEAIRCHVIGGKEPKRIYTDINRSKKWFFKWLKRYKTGNEDWYRDRSRAPLTKPNEVRKEEKELIVSARKRLESELLAQVGVSAIKWELMKLGVNFPSDSQMDFVGPRYIKRDGKFYSLNVIDLYSHNVFIESQRTKEDRQVASSLLRCWKTMGIPDFLQFDNELSFRGSNRYPRSLGLVLRLCLFYGIQSVFIPVGEPWRNGVIERFNDTYEKKFFRRQWFLNYTALKSRASIFRDFTIGIIVTVV
jgi:transposase